jgi:hypothetical protein
MNNTLENLIINHCPSIPFVYGSKTVQCGNAECRIFLDKTAEDKPEYSGIVITNCRIGDESRKLVFSVMRENGDVVAYGKLRGGGRFSFPYDSSLEGESCSLQISGLVRRAGGIPASMRRVPRLELAKGGKAGSDRDAGSDTGAIRVVGARVYIRVASSNLPFDLLLVTASDQQGHVLHAKLYFLPDDGDGDAQRSLSFAASEITGWASPHACTIDAWGVTADPESQLLVSEELLNELKIRSPEARAAIDFFRAIRQ